MSVEFRELDSPITIKVSDDQETVNVRFGLFYDSESPGKDETPVIMLEVYGVPFPLIDDEAMAVASALMAKVKVEERFWRLAENHCKDCVDELIAKPEFLSEESQGFRAARNVAWGDDTATGGCDD